MLSPYSYVVIPTLTWHICSRVRYEHVHLFLHLGGYAIQAIALPVLRLMNAAIGAMNDIVEKCFPLTLSAASPVEIYLWRVSLITSLPSRSNKPVQRLYKLRRGLPCVRSRRLIARCLPRIQLQGLNFPSWPSFLSYEQSAWRSFLSLRWYWLRFWLAASTQAPLGFLGCSTFRLVPSFLSLTPSLFRKVIHALVAAFSSLKPVCTVRNDDSSIRLVLRSVDSR